MLKQQNKIFSLKVMGVFTMSLPLRVLLLFYLPRSYSLQQENLIARIKPNVTATLSRHWSTWSAMRGIDLNEGTNPGQCQCCAGAWSTLLPSWWRLDLGNTYPIKTIIYIGRSDYAIQSRGFKIYKVAGDTSQLIYHNTATTGSSFTIDVNPPVALQQLKIIHETQSVSVCELKLIESANCPAGSFGQHCEKYCHCIDTLQCNRSYGVCQTAGCEPGWNGPACDLECNNGSFGQSCKSVCHCQNNVTCNRTNGECPGGICAPGWKGFNCSTECYDGSFGQTCSSVCRCQNNVTCHHINGECPDGICAPGWIGYNCNTECHDGSFGQNCSSVCHCQNNTVCDRINGECSGSICAPGWKGLNCSTECDHGTFGQDCHSECHCLDQPCDHITGICSSGLCAKGWKGVNCNTECNNGSFGQNCSWVCHCQNNVTCNHITGTCPDGICAPRWKGVNCNTVAEALTEPTGGVPTGAIIGAVCGVIAILIVFITIIGYRKRTSMKQSETNRQTFTDIGDNTEADKQKSVKQSERMTTRKRNSEKETVQVEQEHMYYSFATTTEKIHIHELWEYINLAYNNKCERLHQKFQKLPHGLVLDCNEAGLPENGKKNRYKDMVAYDHSRVILKREDPSASTYINACYIDGFQAENKFIASQGPTENTAGDFWDMVMQEKTSVIVMLTNLVELGKRKCFQYWPSDEKEERTFGDVQVSTVKITILPDYIIRELDIAKTENGGESPRRVTQYHFTAWPDKNVPDVAWHLVNFWRKVVSQVGTSTEPIIVHCSAGVGRTGTYIALDSLHTQAKTEGYIQPFEIVTRMRQQRVNMVQTKNQYVFLHEAVAEALYLGVKSVKTNEYDALYTSLLETDKTTGTTGLEQQFNWLQENRTTTNDENVYCNVKPAKECTCITNNMGSCLYIFLSYIKLANQT